MDFLHKNLNRRKREHSNALMMDFATNLISMVSRDKGSRYSLATNNASASARRYNAIQKNFLQAQRDYSARRAVVAFNDLLHKNKQNNNTGQNKMSGIINPITIKPSLIKPEKPQLINISDFNKSSRTINKK